MWRRLFYEWRSARRHSFLVIQSICFRGRFLIRAHGITETCKINVVFAGAVLFYISLHFVILGWRWRSRFLIEFIFPSSFLLLNLLNHFSLLHRLLLLHFLHRTTYQIHIYILLFQLNWTELPHPSHLRSSTARRFLIIHHLLRRFQILLLLTVMGSGNTTWIVMIVAHHRQLRIVWPIINSAHYLVCLIVLFVHRGLDRSGAVGPVSAKEWLGLNRRILYGLHADPALSNLI